MGKKIMSWKTKGMNRDLSVSAFNPEFAFENMNLRLSTVEGNTMLSWVSERGTLLMPCKEYDNIETDATISGAPIGTAVINHKLVLFTTSNTVVDSSSDYDRIYLITFNDTKDKLVVKKLYEGNLNFCTKNPIETLVSYESETIQKIYWTDGRNQPRVINIMANIKLNSDNQFDFVPYMTLDESMTIVKSIGGIFAPGVIQYCFCYVNEGGQQSNIVDISPLYYITHTDRGAKADETVNNKFTITLSNINTDFDYVRIYAISRSSYNGEVHARLLEEIPTAETITYTDTGNGGSSIDPYSLFYFGGKEITALTMSEKDNTLFLGNLQLVNSDITPIQDYFDNSRINTQFVNFYCGLTTDTRICSVSPTDWEDVTYPGTGYYEYELKNTSIAYMVLRNNSTIGRGTIMTTSGNYPGGETLLTESNFIGFRSENRINLFDIEAISMTYRTSECKSLTLNSANNKYYDNTFTLDHNSREIKTFKGGDTYRFGFQLQKKTGEWSEPIFIQDKNNDKYPIGSVFEDEVFLPYAKSTIDFQTFIDEQIGGNPNPYYIKDFTDVYKRVRPVVVYPNIEERHVVCQGVLNPTVFNSRSRKEKMPYAQSSWFFRPLGEGLKSMGNFPLYNMETSTPSSIPNPIPVDPNFSNHTDTVVEVIEIWIRSDYLAAFLEDKKIYYKLILADSYDNQGHTYGYEFNSGYVTCKGILIGTSASGYVQCYAIGVDAAFPSTLLQDDYYEYDDQWGTHSSNRNVKYVYDNDRQFHEYTISGDSSDSRNPYPSANDHRSFYMLTELRTSEVTGELYYDNQFPDVWPGHYIFKFSLRNVLYTVTFNSKKSEQPLEGSNIEFKHFKPLFYPNDASIDYTNYLTKDPAFYKQMEIQGTEEGPYEKPYSTTEIAESGNTQFFIDQSIVTLNSPDLEFDEILQGRNFENLKLRIVGAIPLTGGRSSHSIEYSGSKLNVYGWPDVGIGDIGYEVAYKNFTDSRGLYRYKKLIADFLWNDNWVYNGDDNADRDDGKLHDFLVYPWQRNGSLNHDPREEGVATSWLKRKKWANMSYSFNTEYFKEEQSFLTPSGTHEGVMYDFNNKEVSVQLHLQENDEVLNMRLPRQASEYSDINYYPNISTVLSGNKFRIYSDFGISDTRLGSIQMKYKSGTHVVIAFNKDTDNGIYQNKIPILPYAYDGSNNIGEYNPSESGETGTGATGETFWGDIMHFVQEGVRVNTLFTQEGVHKDYNFLWLGELYRDISDASIFGGTGRDALRSNNWIICGDAIDIPSTIIDGHRNVTLKWTEGDTYYQRYDCLKTYPFTLDDQNQVVEILSFMCESHVNLDGRCDRNRGQDNNTNMTPEIFNHMNMAYSQDNNFFIQKKLLGSRYNTSRYPNMIWYSKTKTPGADVDLWTNIDLASILDLDGDKGELKSLQRFNNNLIAFQDKGISQILYNENVQISTENGVPVEIANSGKVQGKRYLSNTIGCSNKWSIANTPSGIYFMDSNNKGIYLFNGEIHNMSLEKGFDSWAKNNIPSGDIEWTPDEFDNFVTHYDPINQDILFINKELCLAYSEKFGVFTSFYNYQNSPYFCNIDDSSLWVKRIYTDSLRCQIYKHQAGNNCYFFRDYRPYWMTLVGNPEPQLDKMFTNLELRANVEGDGQYDSYTKKFIPIVPFNSIETWNEYQHGYSTLENMSGRNQFKHGGNNSALNRKFRIWRCDIPRNNAVLDEDRTEGLDYSSDSELGISRYVRKPSDRMRNPWIYLKLKKDVERRNVYYYYDDDKQGYLIPYKDFEVKVLGNQVESDTPIIEDIHNIPGNTITEIRVINNQGGIVNNVGSNNEWNLPLKIRSSGDSDALKEAIDYQVPTPPEYAYVLIKTRINENCVLSIGEREDCLDKAEIHDISMTYFD